jgi:osmotically-inducible protein OsmY
LSQAQIFQLHLIILRDCFGLAIWYQTMRRTYAEGLGLSLSHLMFDERRERPMADLRAEVVNALHWDLAVPRHRVIAEVDRGLVTLQGVVEWAYQKSCAEAIVRRVPGVTGVRNEIAVRAAQESSQPTRTAPNATRGWA